MDKTNRILIIATNADQFEKAGFRTGLWLSELVHFWDVAEKAGYQMDIASPLGGKIPIDPESLIISEVAHYVGMKGDVAKRYEDRTFMNLLENTLKVADVDAQAYQALYMSGGHGVLFDFPKSDALAKLIAEFYESGKIISAICHGPCGLLEVKLDNGDYLINGRNITSFSWKEEAVAKRDGTVPFNLEEELKKRGAKYSKATLPFNAHVVQDGLLITGQNPASASGVGKAVVEKLDEQGRHIPARANNLSTSRITST